MVNNTVYHFADSNFGVEIFLKKREHQKKSVLKKIEDSPYILYWGFKKISFTLHTYVLAKILQNGAKFIQKLTPDFKNHVRNLDNFRQAVGSPKSWNLMGYFCPKNTFLQLKHYIQRIYLTLLSTTCVKIHQIPYVIFETISHFSRHNSSVFFSSNITYFLQK